MGLYTIGDLHLSQSVNKSMEVFGAGWENYTQRLRESLSQLEEDDLLVLCGDTSWGISLEEAAADFHFIDALPGKKLLVKGNHDYWWNTAAKMNAFFEKEGIRSIEILHNNCYTYEGYALCGTRGWFFEEEQGAHDAKVLNREVMRLEASLREAGEKPILCFLHYPPLYQGYRCPEILAMLQKYQVTACYYGHLHGPGHRRAIEGKHDGIDFSLVASDYLGFIPKKIC
ncbi:MAG: metallophosphoesterase [Oscillospiraceae bacterium]